MTWSEFFLVTTNDHHILLPAWGEELLFLLKFLTTPMKRQWLDLSVWGINPDDSVLYYTLDVYK